MEVPENRKWMDNRLDCNKNITDEFAIRMQEFVKFASEQDEHNIGGGKIRCPCKKCKCMRYETTDTVKVHLCMKGFMRNYYHWTNHGEPLPPIPQMVIDQSYYGSSGQREMFNNYEQLVMDVAGPEIGNYIQTNGRGEQDRMIEDPNPEARTFLEMLKAAQSPLWDGCDKYTVLSASLRALSMKADYGLSEGCFNEWVQFMGDAMPNDNFMPKNLYQAKKSVADLGLASIKIECCPKGCMLYYKEDDVLQSCKFCEQPRYKCVRKHGREKFVPLKSMWYFPLAPRLQRLYSSIQTAKEMRWHREHERELGSLCHPSDAEAWKHFDEAWPEFSQDPRNVRLGLCSNGFAPFDKTGKTYSSWPVILTPFATNDVHEKRVYVLNHPYSWPVQSKGES